MKLLKSIGAVLAQPAPPDIPGEYTNAWFDPHAVYWAGLKDWAWAQRATRGGLRFLEVGVYEGRSAVWLIHNLVEPADVSVTLVDPWGPAPEWEPIFERALRNLKANEKLKVCRMRSQRFWASYAESEYDFVYVDGSHRPHDVAEDVRMAWWRLRPGGIMLVDDFYSPATPEAERADVEKGLLETHRELGWAWPPPRLGAAVLYQKLGGEEA
jgi:SAM-dependent methyltransferase